MSTNYNKKIDEYQSKVASKLNRVIISDVAFDILGFELTNEQVTYLVQLVKQKRKKML
jgi:hypothetical protein